MLLEGYERLPSSGILQANIIIIIYNLWNKERVIGRVAIGNLYGLEILQDTIRKHTWHRRMTPHVEVEAEETTSLTESSSADRQHAEDTLNTNTC